MENDCNMNSSLDRFIHANSTFSASQCIQYCNEKNAYVVGADKVVSLNGFEQYLNKSFAKKEETKETTIDPQAMRNTDDDEIWFHVNAFYDFAKSKWLNRGTLSEFDDGLWARSNHYYPWFPVVNDVLGTVLALLSVH